MLPVNVCCTFSYQSLYYLFTHESENGEYGNEQSFQYQKEGLDLEFFDTQSNYVDYL